MYRFSNSAVFVSSGNALSNQIHPSGIVQLSRIQSVEFGLQRPVENIQFLDFRNGNAQIEPPKAVLNLSYINTNGRNEKWIGFVVDGTNGGLLNLNQEKNYYISAEDNEGFDANSSVSTSKKIIGLGQCLLKNYSISAEVGGFLQSSVSLEGQYIRTYTGISGENLPIINVLNGLELTGTSYKFNLPFASNLTPNDPSNSINNITALSSNDVILELPSGSIFGTVLSGTNGLILQSFELNISVDRDSIINLGYARPQNRPMRFPVEVSLTAEAIVNRYELDQLQRYNCLTSGHDINIIAKQPCSDFIAMELYLKQLHLIEQTVTTSIGERSIVRFNWQGYIPSTFSSGTNIYFNSQQGTVAYILESTQLISGYDQYGVFYFNEESIYTRTIVDNQYVPAS